MTLNLITDPWIPVRCQNGERRIIAPWQMAEPDIFCPDWPRMDLNIACYELLIGLVFLADPPKDITAWKQRKPDPERLKAALEPYVPAFNLIGEGPLFLQDLEPLSGDASPVDMLFIDSAGTNTARNNADIMVHRGRYGRLALAEAAMALYTFQAWAPSGGAGNRTSMRGGGPLVTLVEPDEKGLWQLVWANTPYGEVASVEALPWMRPTRTSEKEAQPTQPPEGRLFNVEAFFGMPRRLRLVPDGEDIVGVVQKPWGTNYAFWKHPLSPYYRLKTGTELLPKHPQAGRFSYRNWLGVIIRKSGDDLSDLAQCLKDANNRGVGEDVIVAGWAMDNMKPRDFIYSHQPLQHLEPETADQLVDMIEAAETASLALRGALVPLLAKSEEREAQREEFFLQTETFFQKKVEQDIIKGKNPAQNWLSELRRQALHQFDQIAQPGLFMRDITQSGKIVEARKFLTLSFAGYGKTGKALFGALDLPLPVKQPVNKKGKSA